MEYEAKGTGRDPNCPGVKVWQGSGGLEGSRFTFSIIYIVVKNIMRVKS